MQRDAVGARPVGIEPRLDGPRVPAALLGRGQREQLALGPGTGDAPERRLVPAPERPSQTVGVAAPQRGPLDRVGDVVRGQVRAQIGGARNGGRGQALPGHEPGDEVAHLIALRWTTNHSPRHEMSDLTSNVCGAPSIW